jgi:hypothetical protein
MPESPLNSVEDPRRSSPQDRGDGVIFYRAEARTGAAADGLVIRGGG